MHTVRRDQLSAVLRKLCRKPHSFCINSRIMRQALCAASTSGRVHINAFRPSHRPRRSSAPCRLRAIKPEDKPEWVRCAGGRLKRQEGHRWGRAGRGCRQDGGQEALAMAPKPASQICCCRELEEQADVDEAVAELLRGTGSDPKVIQVAGLSSALGSPSPTPLAPSAQSLPLLVTSPPNRPA